jgi:uncharacterized protein (DUF952 family)
MSHVYKICSIVLWREAERSGVFRGSDDDRRDGFIHFSTAAQVAETATKHFAGQRDLLLIRINAADIGERLRWEPSRGGALFPHLYGDLALTAVAQVDTLALGPDNRHVFPTLPE